jgi:predicted RecA/RadA family phage recombinase
MEDSTVIFDGEVPLPKELSEKIKQGEIVYWSHTNAKSVAYELVSDYVQKMWGITEENIKEYPQQ